MKYKTDEERYYRTSNFYLASFLLAKGLELVNIDKANPKRQVFVFRNSPELLELVESFNNFQEECLIDVRKFYMAIKNLKSKLYEEF